MNAYQSNGSAETGAEIIKRLESEGGQNLFEWEGTDECSWYYIDNGYIRVKENCPEGYNPIKL